MVLGHATRPRNHRSEKDCPAGEAEDLAGHGGAKVQGPESRFPRTWGLEESRPASFEDDPSPRQATKPFPIVGIGASAGGLEAFTQILHALPPDTGMAFVLVQHLAPTHASMLAEILSRATAMPVTEVNDEMRGASRTTSMSSRRARHGDRREGILQLRPAGRPRPAPSHRPLPALAGGGQGHRAIGVILSGTRHRRHARAGGDQGRGRHHLRPGRHRPAASMPHSAIAAGCVDFVLPPGRDRPGDRAHRRAPVRGAGRGRATREAPRGSEPDLRPRSSPAAAQRHRRRLHHYKANTLYRRITPPHGAAQDRGLQDYARFLQSNPAEVEALYQDILISVTSFFRNPEAFEALKATVFPTLFKNRPRHEPLRIWVLGCSTGEEAYSIAMAFAEFAEAARMPDPGPDLRHRPERAGIDKARAGVYPKSIAQDVSPERLRRFFVEVDGSYRISKADPRHVRVRPAQRADRPAVLPDRPDQLPQPAHLPGAARCSRRSCRSSTTP